MATTLSDGLSGAISCKHCCIASMRNLCRSLYTTSPNDHLLLEMMNRSLLQLQENYEVMCVIVASRLRKLGQDCIVLPNTCGMHQIIRRQAFIPTPNAPIPLTYRGFDIDWQAFGVGDMETTQGQVA